MALTRISPLIRVHLAQGIAPMERSHKTTGGMTLIEVVVVLAVVSALLGIAYSSMSG